jgi:hypothetical protein
MRTVAVPVLSVVMAGVCALRSWSDDIPQQYRKTIEKGLEWIAKSQHRDGHWDATGNYPTSMTALGGMVFLMEGSTIRDGKYAERIRKATDWLMDRCQRNGLIGNPSNPTEAQRYMYGHGFGMLFLASVYGEEEDGDRRKKLEGILTRAVDFSGKAQTPRGGWGYVSSADGGGFDEGSVTITQLQGLRAARNAGIVVPKGIIDKANDYLKNSTTEQGGVIYSLAHGGRAMVGGERLPLTAAAIACAVNAGEYNSPLAKKWLEFCRSKIQVGQGRTGHHDEYMHYYYAQALYILGDEGQRRLFPEMPDKDRMNWSKYRQAMFDYLVRSQNPDGSWSGGYVGPMLVTSTHLTILQLDNGTLPIYQR